MRPWSACWRAPRDGRVHYPTCQRRPGRLRPPTSRSRLAGGPPGHTWTPCSACSALTWIPCRRSEASSRPSSPDRRGRWGDWQGPLSSSTHGGRQVHRRAAAPGRRAGRHHPGAAVAHAAPQLRPGPAPARPRAPRSRTFDGGCGGWPSSWRLSACRSSRHACPAGPEKHLHDVVARLVQLQQLPQLTQEQAEVLAIVIADGMATRRRIEKVRGAAQLSIRPEGPVSLLRDSSETFGPAAFAWVALCGKRRSCHRTPTRLPAHTAAAAAAWGGDARRGEGEVGVSNRQQPLLSPRVPSLQ